MILTKYSETFLFSSIKRRQARFTAQVGQSGLVS